MTAALAIALYATIACAPPPGIIGDVPGCGMSGRSSAGTIEGIPTQPSVSLFATICIDGTLHGAPKTLCREFQIDHYATIVACEKKRQTAVDEWFKGVAWLSPHLVSERCGPREPDAEGDDI